MSNDTHSDETSESAPKQADDPDEIASGSVSESNSGSEEPIGDPTNGIDGNGSDPLDPDTETDTDLEQESSQDLDGEDDDLLEEALGSDVDDQMAIDETAEEDDLLGGLKVDTSAEIDVPDRLVDQVIGQDHARETVLKAAKQRRHVMMIGSPGTGKSMLAKAMSQLLPKEELQDVLVYHNPDDGNEPKVRTVPPARASKLSMLTRRRPASETRCGRSLCGSSSRWCLATR
jgi:Lon-B peptidase. Serine peptidase. MEROPS family S16